MPKEIHASKRDTVSLLQDRCSRFPPRRVHCRSRRHPAGTVLEDDPAFRRPDTGLQQSDQFRRCRHFPILILRPMLQPSIVSHVPAVGKALPGIRCALPQERCTPATVRQVAVRHPQGGHFRRARTRQIDRFHEIPMHRIGNRGNDRACQRGAADLTLRHGRAGLASRLPFHPPDRICRQQILRHRIPEQLRKIRTAVPLLRSGQRRPVQLHPSTRQDPRRNLGGHLPDRQARLLEPAHRIQLPDVQGAALQLRKQRLTKPVRQPLAGRYEEAEKNRKVLCQRPPARASGLAPVGRVQLASQLQARHPDRWPMPDRQARHRIKRLTRPR